MRKFNKLFIVVSIMTIMLTALGTTAYAEEIVPDATVPEDSVTSTPPDAETPSTDLDDVKFIFNYTSDSVVKEGFKTQLYTDPISNQTGFELVPNFGIGYVLYDDPKTDFIDGIRINGESVNTLRIPIDVDNLVLDYTISVKTVYAEGAAGDLAQILDGTYDYSKLLTNPIMLFQIAYWAFMAISGIVGIFTAANSKKKKVKTAEEIAAAVSNSMELTKSDLLEYVTNTVKSEILPLAQASVKSGKEAVKAMLISNMKSKDAPSAMLDIFKEAEDIDISGIVDEVREELSKYTKESATKHAANAAVLHQIATNVIQEDVKDATEKEEKPHKSVF